jgi:magnesium-transporting ATPase (P-type)
MMRINKSLLLKIIILVIFITGLCGCASHSGIGVEQEPYGFLYGILHGFISTFALMANIISWAASFLGYSIFKSIQIIGRPNTGIWYYVGFILGLFLFLRGSNEGERRKRKKKRHS